MRQGRPSRWPLAGLALGLVVVGARAAPGAPSAAPPDAPALPGGGLQAWRPAPPAGLGLSAADCGTCHRQKHAAWSASQHAGAWSDPAFQASWRPWPNGWCLNCHLPLAAQQVEVLGGEAIPGALHTAARSGGALAAEGVSCAVCHVRDGALVSAGAPSRLARAAHPIAADPALSGAELCAACHQFPFQNHTPRHPFGLSDAPLQDTVAEWRGSAAAVAGVGCADCHMPRGAHGFPGGHDLPALRRALSVEVRPDGPSTVAVRLQSQGVGHKLPTGDPFRRLTVQLCAHRLRSTSDPCEDVVGEAIFRKTFEGTERAWAVLEDLTVPAPVEGSVAERTLNVPVRAPALGWSLRIDWLDPATTQALPPEAVGAVLEVGAVEAPRDASPRDDPPVGR